MQIRDYKNINSLNYKRKVYIELRSSNTCKEINIYTYIYVNVRIFNNIFYGNDESIMNHD